MARIAWKAVAFRILRRLTKIERGFEDMAKSAVGWSTIEQGGLPMTLYGDRAVEYAMFFKYLGPGRGRLLDVGGGSGSPAPTIAAALGWEVTVIDLLPSPVQFPGVTFVQGDFCKWDAGEARFDRIAFISSIEHFGVSGRYSSPEGKTMDRQALEHASAMLAPRGKILLTVPFGRPASIQPFHRVYGPKELGRLVSPLLVEAQEYYRKGEDAVWHSCSQEEAAAVVPSESFYALAFVMLGKKRIR